ncbi:unnamed protein product [Mycena citricolor]|uniref:Uncharacterized protein n=1 Tax=Mycena citricolor TaxID=2018698 RepID=A0AAD2HUE4_9AGAR|nr:unnamed protein product [Mycena citricolor]
MSSGTNGWVPVTAKYGEHPIRGWTVIRCAQKTEYAALCHFDWFPSAALKSACRTSKCGRSARLAWELYPDIRMCRISYCFSSCSVPHRQSKSSKIHNASALAFSRRSIRNSG